MSAMNKKYKVGSRKLAIFAFFHEANYVVHYSIHNIIQDFLMSIHINTTNSIKRST